MRKKIRVLFAIGSMAGGGSERQVIGLLRELDRQRFAPALYLTYRQGELLPEVPSDVPVFAFRDAPASSRWNYPGRLHQQEVRYLQRVLQQEATQVLYHRTLQMAMVAGRSAVRARVPHVPVVVADPRHDWPDQVRRFRLVKRRLLQRSYRSAFKVVALSELLKREVVRFYGLDEDRVLVSRNAVDLERLDAMAEAGSPDFTPGRFHIVSAGRLQPQKGFAYLIRAMDILVNRRAKQDLRLHILGQGPLEVELKELVRQCVLEDHVQFHGFQQNAPCFYRSAQLVCLASLFEGTPNVLMEAMACRVPIVATDCPSGPRELLQDGKWGQLVPPRDAAALAAAIERAMDRYEDYRRSVGPAREWLENHYSLPAGARRTEQLLIEAVQARH